ncbi:hypothetical protein OOK36_56190 [Streptomyces sp. NBC_00365]|uniref:hypothetical protein n=1 Tax=Streptomyces sp. NBC_00365 TaxID=2975726 RepID=UPI00225579C3|nr:hypothetical protein [Streptomyces sp. NBC_00365]MCX5097795.1 hypothetical protein [Streptomyces sp. NBC_00365]
MKLFDLGFEPEEVIAHPRHQAAQVGLVPLIERVRACRSPQDGYELQQDCFDIFSKWRNTATPSAGR